MTPDTTPYREARTRSVGALQVLYGFVVGLAVTEGLKYALTEPGSDTIRLRAAEAFTFLSLLATAIPFFHGANRYLEATYVTGERAPTRRWALMADFVLLLVQGLTLYALALLTSAPRSFTAALAFLLLLDVSWVLLTTRYTDADVSDYRQWAWVNVAACVLLGALWLIPAGWSGPALLAVAVARTVGDYWISWDFYYPEHDRRPERNAAPGRSSPTTPSPS